MNTNYNYEMTVRMTVEDIANLLDAVGKMITDVATSVIQAQAATAKASRRIVVEPPSTNEGTEV